MGHGRENADYLISNKKSVSAQIVNNTDIKHCKSKDFHSDKEHPDNPK